MNRTTTFNLVVFSTLAALGGCLDQTAPIANTPGESITSQTSNSSPSIWGNPPTAGDIGRIYSFTPNASDPDGDALTFSVRNKPRWASFDASTGRLSGVPTLSDIGGYAGISISVSDGRSSAALPQFAVSVDPTPTNPPPTDPTPTNPPLTDPPPEVPPPTDPPPVDPPPVDPPPTDPPPEVPPPTDPPPVDPPPVDPPPVDPPPEDSPNGSPSISGTPSTSSLVDEAYSFTPNAADPDGDGLTFSIQNQPSWAAFNTSTGAISGTPRSGDVGVYSGIAISVSDGTSSAALPRFSISVDQTGTASTTLSWTAPRQNEDGSPLTDLAGYKIYYGKSSGSYTSEVRIENPGLTRYVIDNLTPDTYYFAATAFNSSGTESRYSGEAVKTVN